MDYSWWHDMIREHITFPSPFVWEAWLQGRNLKQPNTQWFEGNFFSTNNGEKRAWERGDVSSRRSGELSWTRRVAGRDVGFGWFLALGQALDPLLPLCHCHTRARRRLGWTQSLHGAHTSLLKSEKSGGWETGSLVRFALGSEKENLQSQETWDLTQG